MAKVSGKCARSGSGRSTVRASRAIRATVGIALAVAACATPQQQVSQKEDLLAAAGFQVRPADSPHRVAAMKRLPANKFVTKVVNGNPVYLYADPLVGASVFPYHQVIGIAA